MQQLGQSLPDDLKLAVDRFRHWRSKRTRGSRIPEDLWQVACGLAKSYGVSRISQVLKLDYYTLKRRFDPQSAQRRSAAKVVPQANGRAAFVELEGLPMGATCQCRMECEDGRGARLLLQWQGGATPDVTALSQDFWRGR